MGSDDINIHDFGKTIRCKCVFSNDDGNTDPEIVVFKIKTPLGVVSAYTYGSDEEIVRSEAGVYFVDVIVNDYGYWSYRVEGSGGVVGTGEKGFRVRRSSFE